MQHTSGVKRKLPAAAQRLSAAVPKLSSAEPARCGKAAAPASCVCYADCQLHSQLRVSDACIWVAWGCLRLAAQKLLSACQCLGAYLPALLLASSCGQLETRA